jgi:hypothetical protein
MLWSSGGISLVVLLIPGIIVFGYIAFIIPGLIMSIAPTIFIYTGLFSLGWFSGTGARRVVGVTLGVAAMAGIAIGVPFLINQQADIVERASAKRDIAPVAKFGPVPTIAIQQPGDQRSGDKCNSLCQVLLFNGSADRVIDVRMPKAKEQRGEAKVSPVYAYRISRQNSCGDSKDIIGSDDSLGQRDGMRGFDPQKIIRLRMAAGECLVREEVTDTRADLLIRRVDKTNGDPKARLALRAGTVRVQALEILRGGKLVARSSEIDAQRLITPLFLFPMMNSSTCTFNGWEWGRRSSRPSYYQKFDVLAALKKFTTFKLDLPKGADPALSRALIDTALGDPTAPAESAAFALLEDYYDEMREKGTQPGDVQRMARIIADPRITKFWFMPTHKIKPESDAMVLRDPALERLVQMTKADDFDQKSEGYRSLMQIAGRMPNGAYAAPNENYDELMADPAIRRRSPDLIKRLADRGPAATEQLLSIVREVWSSSKSSDGDRGKGNYDAAYAALDGLCRLGGDAAPALPVLRKMVVDGSIATGITESDNWRGTMVALGANPEEFEMPKNMNWKIDRYRDSLRRKAKECAEGK